MKFTNGSCTVDIPIPAFIYSIMLGPCLLSLLPSQVSLLLHCHPSIKPCQHPDLQLEREREKGKYSPGVPCSGVRLCTGHPHCTPQLLRTHSVSAPHTPPSGHMCVCLVRCVFCEGFAIILPYVICTSLPLSTTLSSPPPHTSDGMVQTPILRTMQDRVRLELIAPTWFS